ncbi:hypothetical protein [Reticulibacter mediterranei]|uniref:hypothetical protein n=1 Tax=Reticulibacter mediterranei TaxID=2778369 RepID=UPI001C691C81|nr:hypothetical protein [Reticulibacter mediterranei]
MTPAAPVRAQPVLCCASSEASQRPIELVALDGKRLRVGEEVHRHWKIANRLHETRCDAGRGCAALRAQGSSKHAGVTQ